MQARTRVLYGSLLLAALVVPLLYLSGIASRGLALFNKDYVRLAATYAALAFGAASAAYLAFSCGPLSLRLLTGIALVANIGATLWAGGLWRSEIRDILVEIRMLPVQSGNIGVLVSPANHSPQASSDARDLQAAIRAVLRRAGLSDFTTVRYTYPIGSEEFARHVGNEMHAQIVVWKQETGHDIIESQHHVTVLGANETDLSLDPLSLMLLMATQDTITVRSTRPHGGEDALPASVIVPLATGFAGLASGRPDLAASQFQAAIRASDVPSATLPSLLSHYATSLLYLERPDLALPEFRQSDQLQHSARAWVGIGNAMLQRRDWEAAWQAYSEAVICNPYEVAAHCGLGILYARQRRLSRAVSSYSQAISLDPARAVPHALLALARELLGDIEGAREAYTTSAAYAGPNAGLYNTVSERADSVRRYPPTPVPTATPVPIPTVTPVPTSQLYRVQQGDTLQAIAAKLDVSVDEIVRLNDLPDPNSITIGQLLRIPRRR